MEHSVYILHSEKLDRYYTGLTSDIDVRLAYHKDPEARKFTAKADDWTLVFILTCENKQLGLAIEKHIKAMKSKTYIQNLIKYPEISSRLKQKYI